VRGGKDLAGLTVLEAGQKLANLLRAFDSGSRAACRQALAHGHPEGRGVDKLDLAFSAGPLAVGDHPDVGGDAGVVEELLGQGDQRFQQIVFQDVAADLAFATAGIPLNSGEPFMMIARREPAILRILGVREHVQQKEKLAVADARQSRSEATRGPALTLGADGIFVALPVLAVGWIGDQVVETLAGVVIGRKRGCRR